MILEVPQKLRHTKGESYLLINTPIWQQKTYTLSIPS